LQARTTRELEILVRIVIVDRIIGHAFDLTRWRGKLATADRRGIGYEDLALVVVAEHLALLLVDDDRFQGAVDRLPLDLGNENLGASLREIDTRVERRQQVLAHVEHRTDLLRWVAVANCLKLGEFGISIFADRKRPGNARSTVFFRKDDLRFLDRVSGNIRQLEDRAGAGGSKARHLLLASNSAIAGC
jgi:hypothetical protein